MYKEKLSEHLDGYDLCSDGELTPKNVFKANSMTRVSDGFETSRWKVLLLCKLVSRQSLGSDRVKYLKENVTITNSGGMLNVSMCTKHSLPDQSYLILLLLRPTAPEVSSPDFSEIKGNMQ